MTLGSARRVYPDRIRESDLSDDKPDILSKHAQRRRDVLAKAAITAPVVSLLLTQASRPAHAVPYGTTVPPTLPPV
jgi:hypothetical protein